MGKVINRVALGDPGQASGGVLDLYRELALARLGEGLVRIVLFGARARGDQRAESDWRSRGSGEGGAARKAPGRASQAGKRAPLAALKAEDGFVTKGPRRTNRWLG